MSVNFIILLTCFLEKASEPGQFLVQDQFKIFLPNPGAFCYLLAQKNFLFANLIFLYSNLTFILALPTKRAKGFERRGLW